MYTDNNPLTYVLTTAKLDAIGHRWVAALGMYHFKILYRSRKAHVDVDGLSRLPHRSEDYSSIPDGSHKALCQRHDDTTTNNAYRELLACQNRLWET